jgi:FkbM family methyltransferase
MVDGVRVVVPDSLDLITPYVLQEQGDWFEDEIRFLRRLLQAGQRIIDIGANHGVYALSMAHTVGPTGRVWAFEPAGSTAQFLAAGIQANGFGHVIVERSALADRIGTAQLLLNANSELNSLADAAAPAASASETVALTTLDECRRRLAWDSIDFVKIDAEGQEANILKGGERFFAELSPLVQYEIKDGAGLHLELVHHFADRGYRAYRLVPGLDLLVPFDPAAPIDDYLLNLFACKRDVAQRLAARGLLLDAAAPQGQAARSAVGAVDSGAEPAHAHAWRSSLLGLPYVRSLQALWEPHMASGEHADIAEALRLHALSRDAAQTAAQRFHALRTSLELLQAASERRPRYLALASLARVAHEFGARSVAVNALQQLCSEIVQTRQFDPREPFLAPTARFDSLPPGPHVGNWLLAAAYEQLECLASYSSFYSPEVSSQRLEAIAALGFAGADMERRRQLVQARAASTKANAAAPSATDPPQPWSLLDAFADDLRFDVLDIGAALSERPPYQSLVDAGRARVIGFEPNPAECDRLNREYGAAHRFFPYFVGDGKAATFHETNWNLTGSLFAPNTALLEKFQNLAEVVRPVAMHAVSTRRLDDIAEIDNVDFIKIDIQGGELAVFRHATRALAGALVIQTEVEFVELYRGQPLFADVDTCLRGRGFQFHAFNGISGRAFKPLLLNNDPNAPIRQALWSDAIYVRDWMRLDELDAVKLRKFAVLAHDLLGSYDLAHLVLEALDRRSGGSHAAQYLGRLTGGKATR